MLFPALIACAVIVSTKLVATKCFAKNLKNKKLFADHPFQLTGPLGPTPPTSLPAAISYCLNSIVMTATGPSATGQPASWILGICTVLYENAKHCSNM